MPQDIREHLPEHAQEIYRKAFNSALEQYKDKDDPESTAHAVAWSAVKNVYKKSESGKWVERIKH